MTAPRTNLVEDQQVAMVVADRQTPSAISAEKLDTLRNLAPRPGLVAEEDTAEEETSVARVGEFISQNAHVST